MRSNGSQDPAMPPSGGGGHYPAGPISSRENGGGGSAGGGPYPSGGGHPSNMGSYETPWMDAGMAASVQAKYHAEQSHLLALRQQAAQNHEFQRRLESGRPMGLSFGQHTGHTMQDEEHPPMDAFLNQLMNESPHHGGGAAGAAGSGTGEPGATTSPWHPTPQDGGGIEGNKIGGQPTAAEYLAMMRSGQQPPGVMPPSRSPSVQNSSRHA